MTDSKRKKHSRDKEGDTIADPGLRPKSPRKPKKPKMFDLKDHLQMS